MAVIIAITASTPSLLSLNHLSTRFVTFPKFHDASALQIIILSPLVMSSQYFLTFLLTTVSSFVSVWQLLATLHTLPLRSSVKALPALSLTPQATAYLYGPQWRRLFILV